MPLDPISHRARIARDNDPGEWGRREAPGYVWINIPAFKIEQTPLAKASGSRTASRIGERLVRSLG